MKYEPEVPLFFEYLSKNLKEGDGIGVDPKLMQYGQFKTRSAYFKEKKLEMKLIKLNLVDNVWNELTEGGKNPRTANKVILHSIKYAGETVPEKVQRIQSTMRKLNISSSVNVLVLSELDDIAWLLNLRGSDIENNPFFFSYALLYFKNTSKVEEEKGEESQFKIELYIDKPDQRFVDEEVQTHLQENKITVKPYDAIFADLEEGIGQEAVIGYDPNHMNYALASLLEEYGERAVTITNPVAHTKCVKNATEVEGMRKCQLRDGVALVKYFSWLNQEISIKGRKDVTEYDGAQQAAKFRAEQNLYMGPSFDSISASGENGALYEYNPEKESAKIINTSQIYLLDSGAQFLDGTTDSCRCLHLGRTPTDYEKQIYTRVLRCNLDLQMFIFDLRYKVTGEQLDILARRPLWEDGKDYGHLTGHGVGCFLSVVEGPYGIQPGKTNIMEPGMIVSDEPGCYVQGKFGVRIEDILVLKEDPKKKNFVYWENITKLPYERELIDLKQLTRAQINHINQYHQIVLEEVGAHLKNDPQALSYLKDRCAPLE